MSPRTDGSAAIQPNGRYTYADYKTWPEGERWELIDGTAYNMSPAPRRRHQGISGHLFTQIAVYLSGKPCQVYSAPIDVFWTADLRASLDEIETVTQPDLLVVCDEAKLIDEGIKGPPDFIIEILSPSTAWKDQNDKRLLHERFGVREYWMVNPESLEVLILRLQADGTYALPQAAHLNQPVPVSLFPGLSLKVDAAAL